jgi:cytochrome P450
MDCHWHLSFLPYGERWRQARKLMHRHINVKATPTFHPVQVDAARRLVVDLLAAPQQRSMLPLVARVNVGQTIIKIVYGIDVKGADSEFISLPARLLDLMKQSMMLGRFWVDLVPARKCGQLSQFRVALLWTAPT